MWACSVNKTRKGGRREVVDGKSRRNELTGNDFGPLFEPGQLTLVLTLIERVVHQSYNRKKTNENILCQSLS